MADQHERRWRDRGIAAGAESRGSQTSAEPYDALADLFLGGADPVMPEELIPPTLKFPGISSSEVEQTSRDVVEEEANAPPTEPQPPRQAAPRRVRAGKCRPGEVELVVAAHLPVMASAWVNQWARSASAEAGCVVGLVRERGDEVSVELIGPADALPEVEPCDTIGSALALAGEAAGRWMIQADDAAAAPGLSYANVLTGADDAAVVGCYRTLKQFRAPPGLDVRVTVMGATGEKAAAVERKIAGAAAEFLGREVRFTEPVARIGLTPGGTPMASRLLFRGPVEWTGEALVAAVIEASDQGRSGKAVAATPASADGSARRERPDRVDGMPDTERARPDSDMPRVEAERRPEPARQGLAQLVYGLRAVRVRCPVAAGVELAVDGEGRLHLLSSEASAAESLKALTAASAWAKLNAELVRAADPGIERLDAGSDPILHLVTEEPRQALRLLDSPVKVHVLVPPSPAPVVRALN